MRDVLPTLTVVMLASALGPGLMSRGYAGETAGGPREMMSYDVEPTLSSGSKAPYIHRIPLYDHDGAIIDPKTADVPYSPMKTCGKCHDVETVHKGWHVNPFARGVKRSVRPGEPWIYADANTQTQLPLSYRDWQGGQLKPESIGMSRFDFVKRFGRHTPGGGAGSIELDDALKANPRWRISGKLELDCLACHLENGNGHDEVEWARQIDSENFKWASTAAAFFGKVTGEAKRLPDDYDPEFDLLGENPDLPRVKYEASLFDAGRNILLDITRRIPDNNCYYCHTAHHVGPGAKARHETDVDVHMAAGMQCVDCHRNGLDHHIERGVAEHGADGSLRTAMANTLSCRGCHYGEDADAASVLERAGRLGAPKPLHKGLPPLHLEKMSCTSCHSGPVLRGNAYAAGPHALATQTSMAHGLGQSSEHRTAFTLPHVVSPVFLREGEQIAPFRALWPAYWGKASGDLKSIEPLKIEVVREAAKGALPPVKHEADWKAIDEAQIEAMLKALASQVGEDGKPVYVRAGKVHHMAGGKLATIDGHEAAKAYTWRLGHAVRPAQQSLGVGGCVECHREGNMLDASMSAPPMPFMAASASMIELRGDDVALATTWNRAFAWRGMMKPVMLAALAVMGFVLVVALGRGVGTVVLRGGDGEGEARGGSGATGNATGMCGRVVSLARVAMYGVAAVLGLVLLVTGGQPLAKGGAGSLDGWLLLIHFAAGGAFVFAWLGFVLVWASHRGGCCPRVERGLYWLSGWLGLVAIASIVMCMLPLVSAEDQRTAYAIHRVAALAWCGVMLLHAGTLCWSWRRRSAPQGGGGGAANATS